MSTVEQVKTSIKWCKAHKKKSFLPKFECPLLFLFWPELPVLAPEASRELREEVYEQCELCGNTYNPDSLPVEGLQVGVTEVTQEEFEDAPESGAECCRSRNRVTFAPCIAVESNLSDGINGSNREKPTKESKRNERKTDGSTRLSDSENDELSAEDGDDYSDDEESIKYQKKCLPFRKKSN